MRNDVQHDPRRSRGDSWGSCDARRCIPFPEPQANRAACCVGGHFPRSATAIPGRDRALARLGLVVLPLDDAGQLAAPLAHEFHIPSADRADYIHDEEGHAKDRPWHVD